MRKLIHPETGETITATDAGAEVLIRRGYFDPAAEKPKQAKKQAAKPAEAEPDTEE